MTFLDQLKDNATTAAAAQRVADLAAFQTLLAKFSITATPTELTIVVDNCKLQYLNPRELLVFRRCPTCPREFPSDGVASPPQLLAALAEPVPGHNCRSAGVPPVPVAPVATKLPTALPRRRPGVNPP